MRRNTAILLSATLLACTAAFYYWQQLQMERKRTANLATATTHVVEGQKQEASVATLLLPTENTQNGQRDSMVANQAANGPKETASISDSQVQRLYQTFPRLQEEAGLTQEDIEIVAELYSKGAWESEYEARLGAAQNERLNNYWNSFYAKARISDLRRDLANTDHPLREDQVPPLYSIVSTESGRERDERRARAHLTRDLDPRTQLDLRILGGKLRQESNARVLTAASAFLGAEQRAVLADQLSSGLEEQLQMLEKERSELN